MTAPDTPESVAAAQVRHMRRVGYTPDRAAAAIGWAVPAGVIGWDDITEAFVQIAREMRETLVRRALLECPKTATGAVLQVPRPADPVGIGLVKAGYGRLKTLARFKDRTDTPEIQARLYRAARIRARMIPMGIPRLTERGVP